MKILVAEDNTANSKLLLHLLSKEGYEVTLVEDGQKALDCLEKDSYDILITDWMMPEMDGIQLIKAVRANITPQPLIIMLTSLTSPQAREFVLKSGADDFLVKPFSDSAILKIVRSCLNRKKQEQPEIVEEKTIVPSSPPPFVGVVITSSSGGPYTLSKVIPGLKNPGNASFFLVQHGPEWMLESLANSLNETSSLTIQLGEDGMTPQPGHLYLAPGNRHMLLEGNPPVIRLNEDPEENHVRPAADPLFRSAASIFGEYCIGVVLTGLGYDGARGIAKIVAANGTALVQDPSTATMPYMPQAALDSGASNQTIPLDDMADAILNNIKPLAEKLG